jgi:hypothetical protein
MMLMNLNRFLVRNRNSHGLLTNVPCPKVQLMNGHEDLNWTSTISMNCHLNASTCLHRRGLIE